MSSDNCMVKSCSSLKGDDHVSMHKLPTDPLKKFQWLEAIARCCNIQDSDITQNSWICSEHFLEKDFLYIAKRKFGMRSHMHLKEDAVPSVFIDSADKRKKLAGQRQHDTMADLSSVPMKRIAVSTSLQTSRNESSVEGHGLVTYEQTKMEENDENEMVVPQPIMVVPIQAKTDNLATISDPDSGITIQFKPRVEGIKRIKIIHVQPPASVPKHGDAMPIVTSKTPANIQSHSHMIPLLRNTNQSQHNTRPTQQVGFNSSLPVVQRSETSAQKGNIHQSKYSLKSPTQTCRNTATQSSSSTQSRQSVDSNHTQYIVNIRPPNGNHSPRPVVMSVPNKLMNSNKGAGKSQESDMVIKSNIKVEESNDNDSLASICITDVKHINDDCMGNDDVNHGPNSELCEKHDKNQSHDLSVELILESSPTGNGEEKTKPKDPEPIPWNLSEEPDRDGNLTLIDPFTAELVQFKPKEDNIPVVMDGFSDDSESGIESADDEFSDDEFFTQTTRQPKTHPWKTMANQNSIPFSGNQINKYLQCKKCKLQMQRKDFVKHFKAMHVEKYQKILVVTDDESDDSQNKTALGNNKTESSNNNTKFTKNTNSGTKSQLCKTDLRGSKKSEVTVIDIPVASSRATCTISESEDTDIGDTAVFECRICQKKMESLEHLQMHNCTVSVSEPTFRCSICQYECKQVEVIKGHIQENHQQNLLHMDLWALFDCDDNEDSRNQDSNEKNETVVLISETDADDESDQYERYVCKICFQFKSSKPEELRQHMLQHGTALWRCRFCKYCRKREDYIQYHVKNKHRSEMEKIQDFKDSYENLVNLVDGKKASGISYKPSGVRNWYIVIPKKHGKQKKRSSPDQFPGRHLKTVTRVASKMKKAEKIVDRKYCRQLLRNENTSSMVTLRPRVANRR